MMHRNEADLLEAWVVYHGILFGFENLFIFDNGSTDATAIAVLRRMSDTEAHIDFAYAEPEDYTAKSDIIAEAIRRLAPRNLFDLYFPLDCDEFVIHWGGPRGVTCERSAILDHLSQFVGADSAIVHAEQIANVPGHLDWFCLYGSHKVFFAGGEVSALNTGHHLGEVASRRRRDVQGVGYLHLHYKAFDTYLAHARDKLRRRVDTDDLEALKSYRGHGDHLTPYFLMREEEYLQSFSDRTAYYFPDFRGASPRCRRTRACAASGRLGGIASPYAKSCRRILIPTPTGTPMRIYAKPGYRPCCTTGSMGERKDAPISPSLWGPLLWAPSLCAPLLSRPLGQPSPRDASKAQGRRGWA